MLEGWWGVGSGHKKWAWSWLSWKHRKIYLQICREMGSHTVSIMAWEDDRRSSQRSVFGAGSLNLCYCWQESWDENISTKTVWTINKISVFCKFIYFDWMSVYVFKYLCFCSTVCIHLICSPNFSRIFSTWLTAAAECRAALLTESKWAPNALHLQKLIMHFMILIICNEKNRRKDEKRKKTGSVFYHETLSKFRSAVWRSFPFALR